MKRALTLSILALVVAFSASGGERYLGTITAWDAGYAANMSLMDAGFAVPIGSKLTVQPDGHAYVCVDSHVNNGGALACNGTTGVLVPAGALFMTSCSAPGRSFLLTESVLLSDGGTAAYDGGRTVPMCSVACVALDAGTVNCKVFARLGTEN